jgi:hypothetical protein
MPNLVEMKEKIDFAEKTLEKKANQAYQNQIKSQIIDFSRQKFNEGANKQKKMDYREDTRFIKHIQKEYIDEIRELNKIPMVNVCTA